MHNSRSIGTKIWLRKASKRAHVLRAEVPVETDATIRLAACARVCRAYHFRQKKSIKSMYRRHTTRQFPHTGNQWLTGDVSHAFAQA